jgi:hypothetical protein
MNSSRPRPPRGGRGLKTWQYDRTGTLRVSPPTRGRGLKRHLDPNRGLDPDREQTEMALKEFVSEIKLLFAKRSPSR